MLITDHYYINPDVENFEEFNYEQDSVDLEFFIPKKLEFVTFFYSINKPFPENNFLKNFRFKKTKINDDFKNFITIMSRKGLVGKFRQYLISTILFFFLENFGFDY